MFPTSNRNSPFFNDIIYTTTPHFSKQQEDPSPPFCFFHMPSPYYHQELELQDYSDDLLLFQQDHQQQPLELMNVNDNNNVKQLEDQEPSSQKIPVKAPKRSSSCKKDRHSKINTAQGPRDRRMRLSLKVAREFFDLQDQLGFDRASKTVEWLLFQAKPEIKKRFGNHGIDSTSSTSTNKFNGNSTSTAPAASPASNCEAAAVSAVSVPIKQYSCTKDKQKRTRKKSSVLFDPVAREYSREKARARARERTREKLKNRIIVEVAANHELPITSTSSNNPSFETGNGGSAEWEESAGMMILQQQLLEHESGTSEELNIDADESLMMMLMMHNHHPYNLIPQDQVNEFPNF